MCLLPKMNLCENSCRPAYKCGVVLYHHVKILGKISIYLQFLSFLNTKMSQVVKILPCGKRKDNSWAYSTSWWLKEPGHQQPGYWPNYPRLFCIRRVIYIYSNINEKVWLIEATWRIYASIHRAIIGSDDALLPVWRPAITCTNTGL